MDSRCFIVIFDIPFSLYYTGMSLTGIDITLKTGSFPFGNPIPFQYFCGLLWSIFEVKIAFLY